MRICFWFYDPDDAGSEVGARAFDDSTGERAAFLSLMSREIVTESSRAYPAFGDDDEEIGYILSSRESFDRVRECWPDLDYYDCM